MSTNDFENNYKNWHQKLSFIKSGIRIAASIACAITLVAIHPNPALGSMPSLLILAIGYGAAEIIGIFEEWF